MYNKYKFARELDGFIFVAPSKSKFKKYDVYDSDLSFICSFGDNRYSQFFDKISYYKDKNHYDTKRKERYIKRHRNDLLDELTPGYFSRYYLWD